VENKHKTYKVTSFCILLQTVKTPFTGSKTHTDIKTRK